MNGCQLFTVIKGIITDGAKRVRNNQSHFQSLAGVKGMIPDGLQRIRHIHALQLIASLECVIADDANRFRKRDGGDAGASAECVPPNLCDAIRHSDVSVRPKITVEYTVFNIKRILTALHNDANRNLESVRDSFAFQCAELRYVCLVMLKRHVNSNEIHDMGECRKHTLRRCRREMNLLEVVASVVR